MFSFSCLDHSDPSLEGVLAHHLDQEAAAKMVPRYVAQTLSVSAHNAAKELVGGLTGKTLWNWLYIDLLWVDAAQRGKAIGQRLMREAEEIGRARGCHSAYVWTESYQAPGFYQKCGYHPFVTQENFPNGHSRIGLCKKIAI